MEKLNYTTAQVNAKLAIVDSLITTSITPEAFGAVGDGITDDSTALLAAITYCSQNGIKLISGSKSYRIATNKTLDRTGHKYLNIDLGGATIFCDNASLKFTMPTAFLTTTITSEVTRGRNYIDLSSVAGIIPGDFIEIICPYKSGPDHSDSLHYYVVHELTGNRVYIEGVAVADIAVANIVAGGNIGTIASFTINVYHLNEPINWINTNLTVSDTAGVITGALEFNACKQLWLENFTVDGHCRTQIYIRRNAYDIVTNSTFNHFGYTNDIGTVAPLVSGTPNEYGYGILHERNWVSQTSSCVGKHGWHAFDDTYGQMHSYYNDCVVERASGGFSTHNGVWNVYYDNCVTNGNAGFNVFRACFVYIANCKHYGYDQACSLSAINHEVIIDNCNFEINSASTARQFIALQKSYTSNVYDPKTANPSALSAGYGTKWILKNTVFSSIQNTHSWSFGIDTVNTDSLLVIENNTFINSFFNSGSSTFGHYHHTTLIKNNTFTGSINGQYIFATPVYPSNAGAVFDFYDNYVNVSSAVATNGLFYGNNPSTNVTFNFVRNTIKGLDSLARCSNNGTLNIGLCEDNNMSVRLFTVNTGLLTAINITNLYGNTYNNSAGISNSTNGLTVTNTYGNINKAFQVLQPTINWAAAAPTTGTYKVGDIVYDSSPVTNGTIGWVCVTAGTPGTWKTFGAIINSDTLALIPNTDITNTLNNILATYGSNFTINFAAGNYTISDTINITGDGITISGAGKLATTFTFTPAADKVCFNFSKGASILAQCGIRDCTITSANTTLTKTAIATLDVSQFHLSDVQITGFKGKDSIGLRTYGRENNTYEQLRITADICIRISPNPNTLEWLSVDHYVFRDTYLTAEAGPTATGTIPTTCVLIDNKVMLSGLTFEGRNAWVSGQRGLYSNDTTGTMASYMVNLCNIRREQPTSATDFGIYINRQAANAKLQSLRIENYYQGVDQKGIYLRGIDAVLLENTRISDSTLVALDIDNCTSMEWVNADFAAASAGLFTLPNMEIVKGVPVLSGDYYPLTCSWQKVAAGLYQQKLLTGMNGTRTWEWGGQLANTTQIQIPLNTLYNNVKAAMIEVVAVATDGLEFEAGIWALSYGDDAGANATLGVQKVSGTPKTASTNVTGNLIVYCNSATTALLNNVYIYNRLGKTCDIVARAIIY